MKYDMLIDETHTPRHVCRVPEKGGMFRSFVTSLPLKRIIKSYGEELRDASLAGRDMYLLNLRRPEQPLKKHMIPEGLRKICFPWCLWNYIFCKVSPAWCLGNNLCFTDSPDWWLGNCVFYKISYVWCLQINLILYVLYNVAVFLNACYFCFRIIYCLPIVTVLEQVWLAK